MIRSRQSRACAPRGKARGFTLVELMVTVMVVAILARITIPIYRNYVIRGKLTQAFGALSSFGVSMQQCYQDNRSFASSNCVGAAAVIALPTSPDFTYSFPAPGSGTNPSATTFTVQALGNTGTPVAGFTYTLDQNGGRSSSGIGSALGWTLTSSSTCWIMSDSGSCY